MSISNPLHILAQHLLATSIVELGRAAVGVISHRAAGGGSRLEQAGLLKKINLTGLAPASLIKKYFLDGAAQDIWWNVQDLGYLTY